MTSSSLLEQSKQGNPAAIATLMNHHLQPKGITAKVALKNQCLLVRLEADTLPEQRTMSAFVLKGIRGLNLPMVQALQIYGKQANEEQPRWQTSHVLQAPTPTAQDAPTATTATIHEEAATIEPLVSHVAEENVAEESDAISVKHTDVAPAQQHLEAIALHLNQALGNDQLSFMVHQDGTTLKVIVVTSQILEGSTFAAKVCKEVKSIGVTGLETLEVHKQKPKGSRSFQIKAFPLVEVVETVPQSTDPTQAIHEVEAKSSDRQTGAAKRTNTPQPPKKRQLKPTRVLGMVFVVVAIGYVLYRAFRRLLGAILLSPIFGGFGLLLAGFYLWRSSAILRPLLLSFFQLLSEED